MKKQTTMEVDNASEQPVKHLKGAHVFSEQQTTPEPKVNIKPAILVPEDISFEITNEEDMVTEAFDSSSSTINPTNQKKSPRKWMMLFFVAVMSASIAELGFFVYALTINMDWLAVVWLTILAVIASLTLRQIYREFKGLKQLKEQIVNRTNAQDISSSTVIGLSEKYCLTIAKTLPNEFQPLVVNWQNSLATHHCDSEVLSLFEHHVIGPIDKIALQQVSKNASAAGVMIAVSPFALLDMFIVLWRNFRMMNQISQVYGLNLGYLGRISLVRNVFRTMLYAGAAEILSDAGNYALGTGLTGKISTSVGQGLGAGVLTARIGLKAINESRPLPWLAESKPRLSSISKQLLADLNNQLNQKQTSL